MALTSGCAGASKASTYSFATSRQAGSPILVKSQRLADSGRILGRPRTLVKSHTPSSKRGPRPPGRTGSPASWQMSAPANGDPGPAWATECAVAAGVWAEDRHEVGFGQLPPLPGEERFQP